VTAALVLLLAGAALVVLALRRPRRIEETPEEKFKREARAALDAQLRALRQGAQTKTRAGRIAYARAVAREMERRERIERERDSFQ